MHAKRINNLALFVLKLRLLLNIYGMNLRFSRHPLIAAQQTALFIHNMRIRAHAPFRNAYKFDRLYYWDLNIPGYPSSAFYQVLEKEIAVQHGFPTSPLVMAIVAMTKKCGLNCEHCFEWDAINQKEQLQFPDLVDIIEELLSRKVGQIILSGGDPLNRFPVLLRLLETFKDRPVEFWINTTGYIFSPEKAYQLKQAGLRGVVFSLDHYIPQLHDKFRGVNGSFDKVLAGVTFAERAGLISALSLCATKEFVSFPNLQQYISLAGSLAVPFIQILEPKPAGRYANVPVQLNTNEKEILAKFFEETAGLKDVPTISYPDFNKRRFGCIGGKKYLYVDTDGNFNPCPFCSSKPVKEFASTINEAANQCGFPG